jgi:putative ABC transport system permease protein
MALRVLHRKLLRDLWRLKWQVAAIALLIACGVSVAVMAFSTQEALVTAQRHYYEQTRFGNLFATATRAPLAIAADLARIDGVMAVDPRAMKAGLMEVPGLLRPATARLISLPDDDRRALNRIVVVAGRLPDPDRSDEAVALKTFLDAAHVSLGERLSMVIDARRLAMNRPWRRRSRWSRRCRTPRRAIRRPHRRRPRRSRRPRPPSPGRWTRLPGPRNRRPSGLSVAPSG